MANILQKIKSSTSSLSKSEVKVAAVVLEDPNAAIGWQVTTEKPVVIGSGSWLGTGVVILPGTQLGRNTVVAAGAVVSGTFPDHVVLGGVPARILRHYTPESGWQSGASAS